MPDYLERVVRAGARTSTPGKPPSAAPPHMPGVSQPWFSPVETIEIDVEEQSSVRSSELPVATLSAMPADATAPEPLPEALVPEAGGRERTPPVPFAAAEGSAASAAPMLHPPSALGDSAPAEAAAIIRAPTALRPMLNNVQTSPPQETLTAKPATNAAPESSPSLTPPLRAEVVLPPDTRPGEAGDSVRDRQIEADLRAATEVEQHRTTPAPPLQQPGASPPNPWPTPAQRVPAVSISTGADGRQSRITIGRIDVQVNNQPPAPPSVPPPPGTSPIAADVLEGRFLSRFALKL